MGAPAPLRRARSVLSPEDAPAPVHAPLFQSLVTGLDDDRRHVVLDLGAASTSMLALLSRARCRVEISDFAHFGGIDQLNNAEAGPPLVAAAESWFMEQPENDPVDLVLCWDLLNYLTLEALSALMTAIGRRAHPGAFAHALIFYADREMPDHPGRFIPTTDCELVDYGAKGNLIASPRYSSEDLQKNMGPFETDCARLLRNGMQEYQFRLGT